VITAAEAGLNIALKFPGGLFRLLRLYSTEGGEASAE
jgi:hypothetical protein